MQNLKEKVRDYWVYIVILLLVLSLFYSVITWIQTRSALSDSVKSQSELEFENAEIRAPSIKLSSYEDERRDIILSIEKEDEVILMAEKYKKELLKNKDKKEKQIRCQRANILNMEEWDCNSENIYNKFPLQ